MTEEDLDFNVGLVAVTLRAGVEAYEGVPTSAGRAGTVMEGQLRLAEFSSSDGLLMTAGMIAWPDASMDVQPLDFLAGPDAYRRLERAGRMSLTDSGNGNRVALLRALKHGDRGWPTLATVSWEELDWLAGSDTVELLESHGATRVGRYGDLRPGAKRFVESPAFEVGPDPAEAVFAAFAITRVIPIMKDFGRSGVEVLHA
ncbi:hypothetical protein [Agromyces sp. ZXT2-3]|uniref:hypothetical protein n=1 Tax=Agromyces sp. ZXT2-3 TaxID=3461152 RepID=UPI0040551E30